MEYRNLIFDLDGTLTNSKMGILNSLQYALKELHIENIPFEIPDAFIGPPLQRSFSELFALNKKQTDLAVEYFRLYYGKSGLYENEVFVGIPELVAYLNEMGCKIFVATSKLEKYARLIIEHFELNKYIDDLAGADYQGNHTKSELILKLMDKYRLEPSETLMIGDTHYDIIGARESGINSIAVGYGFGEKESLLSCSPTYYCHTVENLAEFLIGIQ
jgi:phosphoglycolate phosphatase